MGGLWAFKVHRVLLLREESSSLLCLLDIVTKLQEAQLTAGPAFLTIFSILFKASVGLIPG
jgi:hypothetical protein